MFQVVTASILLPRKGFPPAGNLCYAKTARGRGPKSDRTYTRARLPAGIFVVQQISRDEGKPFDRQDLNEHKEGTRDLDEFYIKALTASSHILVKYKSLEKMPEHYFNKMYYIGKLSKIV